MFEKAIFKLTSWYLIIIMAISIFFSILVYFSLSFHLNHTYKKAELFFQDQEDLNILNAPLNPPPLQPKLKPRQLLNQDLALAKKSLRLNLIVLNGLILFFSSIASYFLAKKTIDPIAQTILKQKDFIANASHELKTPLTALKTSIEVALKDKKNDKSALKKILKENLNDIDNLNNLTQNLLTLSSFYSNGNLKLEKIDLKKLIEKATKKISPLAKKKNIAIKNNLQKVSTQADYNKLEQLILIFLDNAVKFTKKGSITVTLTKKTNKAQIKITDTGVGIDKKDIPHIFDRFYKIDKSRSSQNENGFGLGLSIAKEIINKHQGSINLSSKKGSGTTFTITLPIK